MLVNRLMSSGGSRITEGGKAGTKRPPAHVMKARLQRGALGRLKRAIFRLPCNCPGPGTGRLWDAVSTFRYPFPCFALLKFSPPAIGLSSRPHGLACSGGREG